MEEKKKEDMVEYPDSLIQQEMNRMPAPKMMEMVYAGPDQFASNTMFLRSAGMTAVYAAPEMMSPVSGPAVCPEDMIPCPKCGNFNPKKGKFCNYCGNVLKDLTV